MPDSLAEIEMRREVSEIIAGLPAEDRKRLRATPEDQLIIFHRGFGMGLRNVFRQNKFPGLFAHCEQIVQRSAEPMSFDALFSVAIREIWITLQKIT